ncbi:zinc finger protein ZAT1-like [Phragmites australis]|uniref:zinc finger protein ZAT1-like n=1 Tax=Phragmites australis TaxID=29695 RepID=UPI002D7988EE|nr:zinc finger protein ZAT1-like [Phragmites australis]
MNAPSSGQESRTETIGGMPPRGRRHWCKHCNKSFPSGRSLGGHMALHRGRRKHKKQPRSTLSLGSDGDGASIYGLRKRRHRTLLLCSSSDDEFLRSVPKTECQLCFKVFASCDALSMHMRAHTRHERKMVAKEETSREVTTLSNGYCDRNVVVSTPVMLTYGIEEVDAARVLLMISGHSGMYSASEYCNEDHGMDGNSSYRVQKSENGLDYSGHGQTGDAELMKPESSSSDEEMKFSSLSHVLKATNDCKLCGKFFASRKALGGHKKFHKVPDHEKVEASPNSAVAQTGQHLLEVDHGLLSLNLPALSDRNYSSRSPKSELNPWWSASNLPSERMLGVV